MTYNWQYLPQIVEYCCQNKINLYFNTVVSPKESSIKYLHKNNIAEILSFLKSAYQKIFQQYASENNNDEKHSSYFHVVDNNIKNFNGVIAQIELWHSSDNPQKLIFDKKQITDELVEELKQDLESRNIQDNTEEMEAIYITLAELIHKDSTDALINDLLQSGAAELNNNLIKMTLPDVEQIVSEKYKVTIS